MNQCYVSVKFPHLTPSSHQQGGHICVRQNSAGDLSELKTDGNESAMNKYTQTPPFILSSLQQMLQLGSALSPLVQCGSTFVYLSYHSGTCLEWMRKLDLHAWNHVCMCRWNSSLTEIIQGLSCTRWGCVTSL